MKISYFISHVRASRIFSSYRQKMKPLLVAFDFDHTIVNENTDLVVQKLAPKDHITKDVKALYREDGWTAFMQQIFHILHSNGVQPAQIRDSIVAIPAVSGMTNLLHSLKEGGAEVIIVSDSNSVFIQDWLASAQLNANVDQVFTNPAHFNEEGLLNIEMFHLQDWCTLSSKNLCKGHILESYIKERAAQGIAFSRIAYVGDGKNDLCPCLRLSESDFAFAREGFALAKLLHEMQEDKESGLKVQVHTWASGNDILNILSNFLEVTNSKSE